MLETDALSLTNVLRPWLLARLVSGVAAAALCLVGVVVAMRVLRRWRVRATSEGQLALERRAELVAAIVQAGLFFAIVNLALTVLAADRTSASIRGAMCAYGVFASTDHGFLALGTSIAAALACGLWLVLHRFDLRLASPALTAHKFLGLLVVAPIVWIDLVATTAFVMELDLDVVASCCSVSLDGTAAVMDQLGGGGGTTRRAAALIALAVAAAAGGCALWARRRPGGVRAYATSALSVAAAIAAIPAVIGYVAPHAYETPGHLCPFCLLHMDVGAIGWPLFAAIGAGLVLGVGVAIVEASKRASGEPDQADALEQKLAKWTALAWAVAVGAALVPVVRYAILTGGASVFGGG